MCADYRPKVILRNGQSGVTYQSSQHFPRVAVQSPGKGREVPVVSGAFRAAGREKDVPNAVRWGRLPPSGKRPLILDQPRNRKFSSRLPSKIPINGCIYCNILKIFIKNEAAFLGLFCTRG